MGCLSSVTVLLRQADAVAEPVPGLAVWGQECWVGAEGVAGHGCHGPVPPLVSLVCPLAAVERVLHKSHQLQEGELDVSPYYDFLEPLAEDTETTPGEAAAAGETRVSVGDAARLQLLAASPALQELRDAFPDLGLRLEGDGAWVSGGTAAQQQELQDRLLQTLQGMAQEHVPLPPETLRFLQRDDVQEQLRQRLESRRLAACYAPAEGTVVVTALSSAVAQDAAQLLSKALSPFCLPVSERHLAALSSPCWDRLRAVLPCCDVQLAPDGGHLQVVTLRSLEQGTRERLLAFLEDATPDEALVPMEPGALRFLQLHYQDLLGSIAEVTLLPLDDTDVTGFRVRLGRRLPLRPPCRFECLGSQPLTPTPGRATRVELCPGWV